MQSEPNPSRAAPALPTSLTRPLQQPCWDVALSLPKASSRARLKSSVFHSFLEVKRIRERFWFFVNCFFFVGGGGGLEGSVQAVRLKLYISGTHLKLQFNLDKTKTNSNTRVMK